MGVQREIGRTFDPTGGVEQGVAGEPEDRPLVHRHRAETPVELDGRGVPVQHPPLDPGVPTIHRDLGQCRQQRLAQAGATMLGLDEEVLEVDPVDAFPGGEVQEVQREADDLALDLGDQRVRGWLWSEQRGPEVLRGGLDGLGRPFVVGQLADELEDGFDVGLASLADGRMHGLIRQETGHRRQVRSGLLLPPVTGSSMGLSRVGGPPGVRHVLSCAYQHRSREG